MSVRITALEDREVEAVCALAREIWRAHYPPIIGAAQTEYMLAQRYDPALVRAELARGDVWWDVLREDARILAFASSFPADAPGAVKLDKLYVHPALQRRGYGGMLIAHTLERAQRFGYDKVILAVNKRNAAALACYRKYGFEIVEAVVKDIGGGFVMDDFVMQRSLAAEKKPGGLISIEFTKMQGLGNDFVVLDATRRPIDLSAEQLRFIADRHFGIGCDQILQVEPPREAGTEFYYRIFNADGGEVEQCGNGARCFARYVYDKGLTGNTEIRVGTAGGVIVPRLERDGQVTVDMGVPVFEPGRIPFIAPEEALTYRLDLGDRAVEVSVLSMGNPHAVQIVPDVRAAPVAVEGPAIESHPRFPQRVNAGFMQVVDRRRIRLRVYERGVGETLACGTGACAAVVAGIMRGALDRERVTVETRGGDLVVSWPGEAAAAMMTGPAITVFEGEIEVPATTPDRT